MASGTIIEIQNASIYQDDNLVLSEVNFHVARGEFVYLIGKVGSGKSSLIKTITAELPLKEGEGRVCEFDLRRLKRKQIPFLRRRIGIVFQDFQLLSDRSVNDNLLFVLRSTGWRNKSDIKQRIADVLEKVGLKYKDFKMPHQLSGGSSNAWLLRGPAQRPRYYPGR
jgi:cell division transport system ATP-binding protein